MSGEVRVLVPAKINLYLGVGLRRADGYHELTTVYHAISLHDEIVVARRDSRPVIAGEARPVIAGEGRPVIVTIDGEGAGELPVDRDNIAVRAIEGLADLVGADPTVRLHLSKRIPVAGGLAGGSADAAATLVACDALWGSDLPRCKLAHLAAELGSDVPFLLYGGTAVGTGRGEVIEPLSGSDQRWHWVVAAAHGGLSTPAVYAELDRLRDAGLAPPPNGAPRELLAAVRQNDPAVLGAALLNDLEPAALSLRPDLRATLDAGRVAGAIAGMVSGSGPTCVFLAATARQAKLVASRLATAPGCRRVLTATGPVPGARVVGERVAEG